MKITLGGAPVTLGAAILSFGPVASRALGDDFPRALPTTESREAFWQQKAEEWVRENLKDVPKIAKRPKKRRKVFAERFVEEGKFLAEKLPEWQPMIDQFGDWVSRLSAPQPDLSVIANIIAERNRIIEEGQRRRRRKRDMEAVLLLAA